MKPRGVRRSTDAAVGGPHPKPQSCLSLVSGADWLHERLAGLGEQGWALVEVMPLGGGMSGEHHTYVFNRPKADLIMVAAPPRAEVEAPQAIRSAPVPGLGGVGGARTVG